MTMTSYFLDIYRFDVMKLEHSCMYDEHDLQREPLHS